MAALGAGGLMLWLQEDLILLYFLLVNGFYLILLLSAAHEMSQHLRRASFEHLNRVAGSEVVPRISILAPAHNEQATVVDSVRALMSHRYPLLEVVVINDGSKDDTLQVLLDAYEMTEVEPVYSDQLETRPVRGLYVSRKFPQLRVLDKVQGGKSDALNLGLQFASGELVLAMDADTLVEPDALQRLVRPFLYHSNVVAAGGCLRVVNGSVVESAHVKEFRVPRRLVPGCQTVEYIRAFLVGRLGLNPLGGNLIISGAFGLFRREALLEIGGYSHDTVGEDMELVVRLRRRGMETGRASQVAFVPDSVAWTEAPASLRVLDRQRKRWHKGLSETLWTHCDLIGNPAYGKVGLLIFPYFLLVELLSPLVEAYGLVLLAWGIFSGSLNLRFALWFFALAWGFGSFLTVTAMWLDESCFPGQTRIRDRLWMLVWLVVENVGYRQFTVVSRIRGLIAFLLGVGEWGNMERRGFQARRPNAPPTAP